MAKVEIEYELYFKIKSLKIDELEVKIDNNDSFPLQSYQNNGILVDTTNDSNQLTFDFPTGTTEGE